MKVGIIGGYNTCDPKYLEDTKKIKVHTPYGAPSDFFMTGKYKGVDIVLLPRHGEGHKINPTNLNFRANIWGMKSLGVTHILAPSAVGSLKEDKKPGDFVFVDQFIDRTQGRKSTFYDGHQVCHISVAEPTCNEIRDLLIKEAKKAGIKFHSSGTYVVIEGPRFSTKAESKLYQSWGSDVIGMTMSPECVLAREAEICYATVAMVTDYDVWKDEPVSIEKIVKTMKDNEENMKKLLNEVIPKLAKLNRSCACKDALKTALL